MAPVRTRDKSSNPEASTSNQAAPSKKARKHRHRHEKESNSAPGLQKLKASLRQTRRLLAKDNLAADVRVETERRLKALEAELHQAEIANKERALAVRYHKVKFFERQKVTRKLKQAKARLESASGSEKETIASEVSALRVDLNYTLHYPKSQKYISLFPPEIRKGTTAPSQAEAATTAKAREEIRSSIRLCMGKGELSVEPELHMDSRNDARQVIMEASNGAGRKQKNGLKNSPHPVGDLVEDDVFFEDDNESSS
ncbi:hypothetical protein K443DRAFT_683278 [Laccaria amethystina LaAM-08-1]|uniref:rRNA-processing protein EFG1 n=1 Tax=Laccaria amethystina LaAM-08-1 TaxID=1095629 RepID=A0A0C9XBI3_9AGAR|nr:hypothetical protein K443DRAFT_683278 [Laccaria amethystina LaAM-08-1]